MTLPDVDYHHEKYAVVAMAKYLIEVEGWSSVRVGVALNSLDAPGGLRGNPSMVQMALDQLSEKHIVDLDEERKAQMVSNLLVVLCSEHETQPVVNTGTLYQ